MSKTLKAETPHLVFTRGVSDRIEKEEPFAKFVWKSLLQFNRGDWGAVDKQDWKSNDEALESLNNGGWYGRILASYDYGQSDPIWIIRNTADMDGTQAITVLFPNEY